MTRSGLVQVSDALLDGPSLLRTAASNLKRKLHRERKKREGPTKPDGDIYNVHSQVPLNDFQRISQLLTGMYPHHFPQGRGGHYDPYRRHNDISKKEWKEHTYGRAANRSKATDAMLLVHQNIEMKAEMALQAQIMFKDRRKDGAKTITATDVSSKVLLEVVTMLATGATRDEVVQKYPGHQYLLMMIKAVSGRVKGTAHSRKQTRINVQGLAAEKGVTNVWFTLNPDEAGDFNLAMHAGFSKETARLVNSKRVERAWLSTLAARDPAALAKWFDKICHSLIKHVFGFDVKSQNNRRRGGPGLGGCWRHLARRVACGGGSAARASSLSDGTSRLALDYCAELVTNAFRLAPSARRRYASNFLLAGGSAACLVHYNGPSKHFWRGELAK